MNMTKKEVALIQGKADLFDQWEGAEVFLARGCADLNVANEHSVKAVRYGSFARALRDILIELGYSEDMRER